MSPGRHVDQFVDGSAGYRFTRCVYKSLSLGGGESCTENIEFPVPDGFNHGLVHVSLHEPDTGRCVSENRFLVDSEQLAWKEHFLKRGDGQGGYTCHAARQQVLPQYEGRSIVPYGLATMDNGEVILAAGCGKSGADADRRQ